LGPGPGLKVAALIFLALAASLSTFWSTLGSLLDIRFGLLERTKYLAAGMIADLA
jgi:hypothetical protein